MPNAPPVLRGQVLKARAELVIGGRMIKEAYIKDTDIPHNFNNTEKWRQLAFAAVMCGRLRELFRTGDPALYDTTINDGRGRLSGAAARENKFSYVYTNLAEPVTVNVHITMLQHATKWWREKGAEYLRERSQKPNMPGGYFVDED